MADPREKMANRLLAQGGATMKEILTMSFGEWPPKGLDINPNALYDRRVGIALTTQPYSGWADVNNRIANINKEYLEAQMLDLHPTMGHEGLHILQFDYGMRAEEMFGRELGRVIDAGVKIPPCNKIMNKLLDYDKKKPSVRKLSAIFNSSARYDKKWVKKYYINTGYEIQARLHVILSEAYQDWKNMPQNRDELWQALESSKLVPPSGIAQYPKSPSFRHRPGYYPSAKENQAVREMKMFVGTLSKSGERKFWNETLPALYANLIEMYGDRQGRERFGLGVNTIGQVQQAALGRKAPSAKAP